MKNFSLNWLLLLCLYFLFADQVSAQTVLTAPGNLTVTAPLYNRVNLQWTDNLGELETGFEIYRDAGSAANFVLIATVAKNVTTYQDDSVTANSLYYYRIRAKSSSQYSAFTSNVQVNTPITPPATPGNLAASVVSSNLVRLTWDGNNGSGTTFIIERANYSTASPYSQLAVINYSQSLSYDDNSAQPGTNYCYRIIARNSGGNSAYSNARCVTTTQSVPAAPARLTASAISYQQINLSWTDLSGNETGFQIERSANGTNFNKIADVTANVITYEDKGVAPLTKFFYRVRALNAIGFSDFSNVAEVTSPQAPLPDKPKDLTAVPLDFDLIQLRWSPLSANAQLVVIERSLKADADFIEIGRQPAAVTEFPDHEILDVADYYYRIKAVNAAGNSAYSDVAMISAFSIITGTEPVTGADLVYAHHKTLYVKLASPANARLTLFNKSGAPQKQFSTTRSSQTDLSFLGGGIYLVVIETNKQVIRKKIVLY